MTLGRKQEIFAENFGKLIVWVYRHGDALRLGEVHRPEVTAKYYASIGKGISKSLHRSKLAADVILVKNGKVTWRVEDYRTLADYWKSLHPDNRAGIDFKGKVARDAGHISMTHGGRQ